MVVTDGLSRYLIEEHNNESLAKPIKQILSLSSTKKDKWAAWIKKKNAQEFNEELVAQEYLVKTMKFCNSEINSYYIKSI